LDQYKIAPGINTSTTPFDSNGLTPPFATSVSHLGVAWQQAANNLYAETTFVCPAYWLADAYTSGSKRSWRYQFSPPDAIHGADLEPLTDDPHTPNTSMDYVFRKAFQSIWGNFIVKYDPTLGPSPTSNTTDNVSAAEASSWLPWGRGSSSQSWGGAVDTLLNLNVTQSTPPAAKWNVADGNTWEGGRRTRCDLWVALGAIANL
jgi:hypothetical protein